MVPMTPWCPLVVKTVGRNPTLRVLPGLQNQQHQRPSKGQRDMSWPHWFLSVHGHPCCSLCLVMGKELGVFIMHRPLQ
jgi:hypothetical protein